MALTLTPGAAPIFLTKNYFNGDAYNYGGTFSVSSNSGLGPRVFDMDPFAYWQSVDNTDGNTETVSSQLYDGYTLTTRAVGVVALLNINLANFIVYYSTDGGSTWSALLIVTGNTAANYIIDQSSSPISMNALRVDCTTTIVANQQKQIGTIVACGVTIQTSRPPDKLRRKYFDQQRIVKLADGSEDITYVKRSPASHELYGCELTWMLLPDADRDGLRTVRRTTPNFCLMPEPGDRQGDIFYGRFDGDWSDEPSSQWKGAGNTVAIGFREITS